MSITSFNQAFKQSTLIVVSFVLIAAFPASALAEDAATPTDPPADTTQVPPANPSDIPVTPPAEPAPAPAPSPAPAPAPDPTPAPAAVAPPTPSAPGPQKPNGAGGGTYKFNPATGMWENDHYAWDPVTKKTYPKTPQNYSYNPQTGHWDTVKWVYDPTAGKYVPNVVSVAQPPAGAKLITPMSLSGSGPGSNLNGTNNGSFNGVFNGFYNAAISNNLSSVAKTGDAGVMFNTLGGNATTGNALAMANVINMLQSQAGILQGNNLATFVANVNGDVTGDIMINPNNIGPKSNVNGTNKLDTDVTINEKANGEITNNIDLAAETGDATVSGNTKGGNATTGNADAVANIMNLINSIVSAGQSFMGVVNVNGNLNGDILLPQDMLNSLIASSGPSTTIDVSNLGNTDITANLNNNYAINNNVNANSASGDAKVSGNTTGGSATTGSATNKLTVLNLTGREVVGSNCLLVFVNVLGNWVGMIMDAPAGSTSAALGGNVTKNNLINTTANINSDVNQTINNNLNLNSQSGDAKVKDNTTGGNATSGNATTSANIANINGSNLNLTDWLGILFINVFGTWNGSFGVNTSAGDKTPAGGMGGGAGTTTAAPQAFKFVATGNGGYKWVPYTGSISPISGTPAASASSAFLPTASKSATATKTAQPASMNGFSVAMIGLGLLGFAWLLASTEGFRRYSKKYASPAAHSLQALGSRLLTFLF